jgi:hypothetical protein
MAGDDPFRGIKLSEQASSQGLEQRLFAPTPKAPDPEPQKPAEMPPSAAKPALPKPEPPKPAPAPKVVLKPASLASSTFNLDDEALYKASYVFTIQELEALEDMKLELKRELDSKVTKNDLVRAALHQLVEDYRDKAQQSDVVRRLRRRRH